MSPQSAREAAALHAARVSALADRFEQAAGARPAREHGSRAAERNAARIAAMLADPEALAFALELITRVGGIEDPSAAGREFDRLSRRMPRSFSAPLRIAALLGGGFAPVLPRTVVPIARRLLRHLVSHLVLDATPAKLGPALARLAAQGGPVTLVPLGEPVLGPASATRRISGIREILERDDVAAVVVDLAELAPARSVWAFDEAAGAVAAALRELIDPRDITGIHSKLLLRVRRSADVDVAVAALAAAYDDRPSAEPGLVVATPVESTEALTRVAQWSARRAAAGGAPLALTIDATAWAAEASDSSRVTLPELVATALRAEPAFASVTVLAGRALDLAEAIVTAEEADAASRLHLAVPFGFEQLRTVIEAETNPVGVFAPVAAVDDFAAAIDEVARLLTALAATPATPGESGLPAPLFDPARVADRDQVVAIARRSADSALGVGASAAAELSTPAAVEATIARALSAAQRVHEPVTRITAIAARAAVLGELAPALREARVALLEVLIAETGMVIDEALAEIAVAIDVVERQTRAGESFMTALAEGSGELDAEAIPPRLLVVEPAPVAPLSTTLMACLAAWRSGGAVIVAPAEESRRSVAVLLEVLWRSGADRDSLQLAAVADDRLRTLLFGHTAVDAVAGWRAELGAETPTRIGGAAAPGVMVITPSADLACAAADLVSSAFAQAGHHPRAVSHAILVGSVGQSEHFRELLRDATSAITTAWPSDPAATLGPIPHRAHARLLTALGGQQRWLVAPAALDFSGRLWSPGIREHEPGDVVAEPREAVPVLELHTAPTLEAAVELLVRTQGGRRLAIAAIHARDPEELRDWLDWMDAAELVINAATTSAVPAEQPRWMAAESGGDLLAQDDAGVIIGLSRWRRRAVAEGRSLSTSGVPPRMLPLIEAAQPGLSYPEFDRIRRAARSDALTETVRDGWRLSRHGSVGASGRIESAAGGSVSAVRFRPVPVLIRLAEGAALVELVRVLLAASAAGTRVWVSSAVPLPATLVAELTAVDAPLLTEAIAVETDAEFAARLRSGAADAALGALLGEAGTSGRIRLIGAADARDAETGPSLSIPVVAEPVTEAGRIEVAVFQRRQSLLLPGSLGGEAIDELLDLRSSAAADGASTE